MVPGESPCYITFHTFHTFLTFLTFHTFLTFLTFHTFHTFLTFLTFLAFLTFLTFLAFLKYLTLGFPVKPVFFWVVVLAHFFLVGVLAQDASKPPSPILLSTEDGVPSSELTASAKATTEQGQAEMEETPPNLKKTEVTLEGALETTATRQENSYRFHDLKDHFLAISKELTDMALNHDDSSLKELNPPEESLVKELRDFGRTHNIPAESFLRMFAKFWDVIYLKVWQSPDQNMRRRILGGIQGVVEVHLLLFITRKYAFICVK